MDSVVFFFFSLLDVKGLREKIEFAPGFCCRGPGRSPQKWTLENTMLSAVSQRRIYTVYHLYGESKK